MTKKYYKVMAKIYGTVRFEIFKINFIAKLNDFIVYF